MHASKYSTMAELTLVMKYSFTEVSNKSSVTTSRKRS